MLLTQLKVNQILIVASSLLFIKYKKKFTTIYTSSPIIVQSSVEFQPAKPLLILCGDTKNNIGGISRRIFGLCVQDRKVEMTFL